MGLTVAALSLVAILGLLEAGLRVTAAIMANRSAAVRTPGAPDLEWLTRPDRHVRWSLRPDVEDFRVEQLRVDGARVRLPDSFTVSTNALGLRVVPGSNEAASLRILALGDSTTFGLGVNDDEAWPAQLLSALEARLGAGPAAIFNGGVVGYSIAQVETRLGMLKPVVDPTVVIVTAGNNDATRESAYSDRERIAADQALSPRALKPVLYTLVRGIAVGLRTPSDAHPPRVDLAEFEQTLERIHRYCEQNGIHLVLVRWPWHAQWQLARGLTDVPPDFPQEHYQHTVMRFCDEVGVTCVDVLSLLAADGENHYFDAVHLNAPGNRRVAEGIADAVLEASAAMR